MDNMNESLLRKSTKEKMDKLYKEIKKQGGDIGERVSKSEKTKESDIPNAYHINNPFDGKRKIDTFESFCLRESHCGNTSLEDMYTHKDGEGIDITDMSWIRGTDEDKLRPMFNNHPNINDIKPIDILRIGKFVEFEGKLVQILDIKNKIIFIDIINKDGYHETKEYDLVKFLKKIKTKE